MPARWSPSSDPRGAGSSPGGRSESTARTTGLLYLGFFITGIAGFLIVRAQLFVAGDPEGTLSNLVQHESLARLGIGLELGIVLTRALTAVWFYRLFRSVDAVAAGALVLFGIVNAVAIMGSAAMLATALEVAGDPSLAVTGGSAATVQLLYVVSGHLWVVAGVFFGLWLIPDGLARDPVRVATAAARVALDRGWCGLRAQRIRRLGVLEC